jgi:hypothetical protein
MGAVLIWLPWMITCILLLAVAVEYRLKHVASDRRTSEHKTLRRILLWIACCGIVAQQGLLVLKDQKNKKEDAEKNRAHKAQLDELKSDFAARSTVINSNQLDLAQRQRELVTALVTNSTVDASTRAKIQVADQQFQKVNADVVDLNAWRQDLIKRQSMNALQAKEATAKAEKELWEACVPIHDYTVRRLEWILGELGRQRKETLESNFKGIPPTIINGPIAELRLGTNTHWHFTISVGGMPHPHLFVSPKTGSKKFTVAANSQEVIVGGVNGNHSNYREVIDTALKDYLASIE